MSAAGRIANRVLGFAHRQIGRVHRLLPEVALALLDQDDVIADGLVRHYSSQTRYTRSEHQEMGLYPFERRAIEAFFPPPPARLLVPGAGAGREVIALRRLGYFVEGFDASPDLVAVAVRALGSGVVRHLDLASWAGQVIDAAQVPSFAGILTGWGFWTHLVKARERAEALGAFRRVCPSGPLLLSFWSGERLFDERELEPTPPSPSWGRQLSKLRQDILRLPAREPGGAWSAGMFAHTVREAELTAEAKRGGYRVVHFELDARRFPNAVLR